MTNTQKAVIFSLFVIFIIFGSLFFYKKYISVDALPKGSQEQQKETENEALQNNGLRENEKENNINGKTKDPETVVKKYYENIIERLNGRTDVDLRLDLNYVTDKIVNNYRSLSESYPDGIGFDPFLCAQDYPNNTDRINLNEIKDDGVTAIVEVEIVEGWGPITVSLIDLDGWRINELECQQGFKM